MHFVPRLAVPVIALALAVAGCGGAQVTVQEVPGGPVDLAVPGDGAALNTAATPTPTATATATPTAGASTANPAATPTPTATGTTGTGTAGGGTAAPGTSTTTTTPPPAGSDAQKFEDFCAQNPGAC
jgi:hypothetical protein